MQTPPVTNSPTETPLDTLVADAGEAIKPAPTARAIDLEFKGEVGAYFRLWIVNTALTLITLGIYSAWAKVRRVRYLYGNTYLGDTSFEYLADPRRVLAGRLIAAILIIAWFAVFQWGPIVLTQWAVVLPFVAYGLAILIAPFLIFMALRFRLGNTAHRSLRFGFDGNSRQSFIANGCWLLAGLLSAGLLYPVYVHRRIRFLADHARFGDTSFKFSGRIRSLYGIYAQAAALSFLILAVAGGSVFLYAFQNLDSFESLLGLSESESSNTGTEDLPSTNQIIQFIVTIYLITILSSATMMGFLRARLGNYTWNNLRINNTTFHVTMKAYRLMWIYFTNIIAVIASFGLLSPWAKIRATRYRVNCVRVLLKDDLNSGVSKSGSHRSAFGEEAAGFFDVDFGL